MAHISVVVCVYLVITCGAVLIDDRSGDLGSLRLNEALRIQRSASLTQLGIEATQKLLTGARKLRSKKRFRRYEKPGSFDTALEDFLSVKPKGVTQFHMTPEVMAMAGNVGDRKILLIDYRDKLSGAYVPVIEIIHIDAAKKLRVSKVAGHYGDRIIYKKSDDHLN